MAQPTCEICGEPMPPGEEMFKVHGFSGDCPNPPLPKPKLVAGEHIEQFFAYEHLPQHLQEVSKPFGDLARSIIATLPRNPERTVALRKLLESKDAAVRAKLAKE